MNTWYEEGCEHMVYTSLLTPGYEHMVVQKFLQLLVLTHGCGHMGMKYVYKHIAMNTVA